MKTENKMKSLIIGIVMLALSFVLVLTNGFTGYAAENDQATITLHKKKMDKYPGSDSLVQNTGKEMAIFKDYENFENVEFKIYDATPEFYKFREEGQTTEEAIRRIQSARPEDLVGHSKDEALATGKTNSNGELNFTVDKKNKDGKDAVYLIIESPQEGVILSANLVVGFPVYEMKDNGTYTDNELNTIHLYPKNLISSDGSLEVIKKGSGGDNTLLNGAEFIISKEIDNGTKKVYINGANTGLYTWTETKKDAYRFVTGKEYMPMEKKINVVDSSTGKLSVTHLENGKYELIEVKAPNNAEMINKETTKKFEINNNNKKIKLTVLNDVIKIDKSSELNNKPVEIGQKVDYKIETNIPVGIKDTFDDGTNRYKKFQLIDKHSEGLTFVNEKTGNFAYKLFDGNKEIDQANYTVEEQTNGFIVSVKPEYITSLTPDNKLKFTYFMYLNDKVKPGMDYTNTATVETDTLKDESKPVTIKTGGALFKKIDKDASKQNNALKDATFVIQNETQTEYVVINDKTKEVTWTADKNKATTFTSDKDGKFEVSGLKYGTYYLVETKAPDGYVILDKPIKFVVNENSHTTDKTVTVMNKHKGSLPITGGIGTIVFSIVGISTFVLAILYFRRRLSNAN